MRLHDAKPLWLPRWLTNMSDLLVCRSHVPTADTRILEKGTAYQTDVGMTGPFDSVIGMSKESVMDRFYTQMPVRFKVASEAVELNAALIDVDAKTGKANSIKRIHRK